MKRRGPWLGVLFFVAFASPLFAGGVYTLIKARTGERAQATVRNCERSYRGATMIVTCTGTWVTGGSLLDGGRVSRGTIEGANFGDVGKTVDVRLADGKAYTTGLGTPLMFFCLGLFVLVGGLALVVRTRRSHPGSSVG